MDRKIWLKRLALLILILICYTFVVSCSRQGEAAEGGNGSGAKQEGGKNLEVGENIGKEDGEGQEKVYVPSFREITGADHGSCRNLGINCGFLYYSVLEPGADGQNKYRFYRQSLMKEGSWNPAQELYGSAENRDELSTDTYTFFTDAKGYGYFILRKKESGMERESYFLCKYGISGSELFRQEITREMTQGDTGESERLNLFRCAVTDEESCIYLGQTEVIFLYDKEGNLQAKVSVPGELVGMGCGRDGVVYVTYRTGRELVLGTVDFGKGGVKELYAGFPGDGKLYGGTEHDILTMDREKVYGFGIGMEAPEVVLAWGDLDLYGDEIAYLHGLEEGRLLAVAGGAGEEDQMVFLTPHGAEKVPEKEVITIGIMSENSCQELDTLAARFNRSSDRYRVEIIPYGQGSQDLNALTDAMSKANMAILTGNGPDLIGLSSMVVLDTYVKKGVLEDLTGYLEDSSVLQREDLLECALEQFTYGDKLYGIPRTINLDTIMGRTSQVGEKMGWTIEEMKRLVRDHPDARLFRICTKSQVLRVLLTYNMQTFVDWMEGTCCFDSAEFRELLEFADSFPLEQLPDENLTLENGGILLETGWMYHVGSYTTWRESFGGEAVTCIGYPGSYGCGTMIDVGWSTFGISAFSEYKEGAWEFMEFMLTDDSLLNYTFPVNKALLEKGFLEDMGMDYVYDGDGNIVRDEDGVPQTRQVYEMVGLVPTWEDVEAVKILLEAAEPENLSWGDIYNIINEEAAPYFYGQKTLDEVVRIIQRRAQLYVSENQ